MDLTTTTQQQHCLLFSSLTATFATQMRLVNHSFTDVAPPTVQNTLDPRSHPILQLLTYRLTVFLIFLFTFRSPLLSICSINFSHDPPRIFDCRNELWIFIVQRIYLASNSWFFFKGQLLRSWPTSGLNFDLGVRDSTAVLFCEQMVIVLWWNDRIEKRETDAFLL